MYTYEQIQLIESILLLDARFQFLLSIVHSRLINICGHPSHHSRHSEVKISMIVKFICLLDLIYI